MADFPDYLNPEDTHSSSSSTMPVPAPVIDLTESDDTAPTGNLNTLSTENFSGEANCKRPHSCDPLDDSFSIVYENITPVPELHIVDFAGDLAQLVQQGSASCGVQMSSRRKVKIGSKSMNISISICKKTESPSTANEEETSDRTSPEIIDVIEKSPEKFKISCGICLDTADEITASNRKLVATVCGHVFCCHCFSQSMSVSKLCPNCRKRLTKKQFHPLYL